MKIVVCSNFDEEFFPESFIRLPSGLSEGAVRSIHKIIIDELASDSNPIYWRVVPDDYVLQKGFEP